MQRRQLIKLGLATAGAAVALQQPAPEVTTLPDTYTVTVAAP